MLNGHFVLTSFGKYVLPELHINGLSLSCLRSTQKRTWPCLKSFSLFWTWLRRRRYCAVSWCLPRNKGVHRPSSPRRLCTMWKQMPKEENIFLVKTTLPMSSGDLSKIPGASGMAWCFRGWLEVLWLQLWASSGGEQKQLLTVFYLVYAFKLLRM